jgi:3-oxoacyl-[acyl-carrier protein] reductase
MSELSGRVALVTGAAKNIGLAIARELAQAGAAVVLVARSDIEAARAAAGEIARDHGRAIAVQGDVSDPESVRSMIAEAVAQLGRLDILVNNAGIRPESAFDTMTIEEWDLVLAVNLDGPFLCTQAALPHLAKSDAAAVVNIGGLTAYTGAPKRAHVVASKAGLDGLTKALAVELAPRGITVNLVSPGLIATERLHAAEHHKTRTTPLGRRGRPEDVAAMVRLIVGPNGRYLTGQTIHVNGGTYLP